MDLYSECCGSEPQWDVHEFDGELLGLCSSCGEHATFVDAEDDYGMDNGIDWGDQVEYIQEHMDD